LREEVKTVRLYNLPKTRQGEGFATDPRAAGQAGGKKKERGGPLVRLLPETNSGSKEDSEKKAQLILGSVVSIMAPK